MTEAEQFAECDRYVGGTLIVFCDRHVARRYIEHRERRYPKHDDAKSYICVEDPESSLCVLWREPVDFIEAFVRALQCRWLMREVLDGRQHLPPGRVGVLWTDGRSGGGAVH